MPFYSPAGIQPAAHILCHKALSGTQRRTEARQSTQLVKMREAAYKTVVHRRKDMVDKSLARSGSLSSMGTADASLVRNARRANDARGVTRNTSRAPSRSPSRSNFSPNPNRDMVRAKSASSLRGSNMNMTVRKEGERSVLFMAYELRARSRDVDVETLPGMLTAREKKQGDLRETVKRLRPTTAGPTMRRENSLREINESSARGSARPVSAQLSRRERQRSPEPREPQYSPTLGLDDDSGAGSSLEEELGSTIKSFNKAAMLSNLTIEHSSLGVTGVPVCRVPIISRAIPAEAVPPDVSYKTTHLHRLRMGYLSGEGHGFVETVRVNEQRSRMREKLENITKNRPSSAGAMRGTGARRQKARMWKPQGSGEAWRKSECFKL